MDIVKLVLGKLNCSLLKEEEVFFQDWIDKSEINKGMFGRLECIKQKGGNFNDVMHLNMQMAWNKTNLRIIKNSINYN